MKIGNGKSKWALMLFFVVACVWRVEAGPKNWVGGTTGHLNDWNTAANWNPSGVPATTDNVTIPSGVSYYPVLSTAPADTIQNITVNAGATFTLAAGGSLSGNTGLNINGTLDITGGSLLMPVGNLSLMGTLTMSGGVLSIHDFTGNGTASISGGTLEIQHDFSFTGTAVQSGGLIQVGHDYHETTANFTATGGTVEFTSSSGPGAFPAGTYQFYNVLIDASVNPGFDNSANTIIITGNWTNNGSPTLTGKTTTVVFSGTGAQTVSGSSATTFENLTINNNAGVTLASATTVDGTLTLSHGALAADNGLNFGVGSVVSGGGAGSYITGSVSKSINVGANQTIMFPVGSAAGYTPVTLSSLNVTTAGTLTITATPGQHPKISSSGINPAEDAALYWTITAGSGLVVSSYSATFNYVVGDVEPGANPTNFVVRRYSGGWSAPITSAATALSTTATGLTGFGDFAVGQTGCTVLGCGNCGSQGLPVNFVGVPNHAYTIQASTDLKTWVNLGSATAGANGAFQFMDANAMNYSSRFYRTVY